MRNEPTIESLQAAPKYRVGCDWFDHCVMKNGRPLSAADVVTLLNQQAKEIATLKAGINHIRGLLEDCREFGDGIYPGALDNANPFTEAEKLCE